MRQMGTSALFLLCFSLQAIAGGVSIDQHTRTYGVSGDTIQEVVKSMKRNGPHSDLHGRRALGMADYRYRTNLRLKRESGSCKVEDASVSMRIWFIIPRLRNPEKLKRNHQSRWRRIRSMIVAHENQHGRYYRQFANQLHTALRTIRPQKDCSAVRRLEKQIKVRLEKANVRRNRAYDRGQYRPFNRRLKQLAPKRR